MASRKLVLGGAGAAALGVRVARALHARRRPDDHAPAPALIGTADARPDVSAADVAELREDLRRELERLAGGDVKASRTRLSIPPQG